MKIDEIMFYAINKAEKDTFTSFTTQKILKLKDQNC